MSLSGQGFTFPVKTERPDNYSLQLSSVSRVSGLGVFCVLPLTFEGMSLLTFRFLVSPLLWDLLREPF